ncbi:phage tail tape measure protein [Kitasatospora sp. NPDC018058]|uniref:phage tail tape measure protein n=1 Tax=Kitasatospora sp. NPDC018058 TaxID=3364025 RepID=UPI0037C03B43
MGGLPPVFIEFIGSSAGVKTAVAETKVALAEADAAGAGAFQRSGMLGKAALAGLGVAAFEAGKHAIEAAGDFQVQMTRVRTGAGEAAENMQMVSNGVLAMAGQVGQSTEHLTAGLYQIESAGYHGSAALEVLKNSAMGAKVGAAELSTVADATTTAMNAYKMSADQSAEATNALIATESEGKTNLEALAGSMSKILPTAAAAHVGLNEVLGAMATMTAQGTSADVAATYLRQTIGNLSNPSGKAAQEMRSLGLSSVEVSQNLGKNGLASTLEMLTDAIQSKMGPAGTVLIEHLRAAAKDTNAYQKVLANLKPDQQTYIGALADMVGGTKSMMAALELTGPHMQDFKNNTAGINEHVKAGGKSIEGWADVQQNFNQKLDSAKASAGALAIQIGQYLMPVAEKVAVVIADGARWLTQHEGAAKAAAFTIGGVLVFALAALTAQLYAMAAAAATNPVTWIILGVVALVAALVVLAMHWRQVWDWIRGAGHEVAAVVVAAWHWMGDETDAAWQWVSSHVQDAWHGISNFFVSAWHTVTDPIVAAWQWVVSVTSQVWGGIHDFFAKWWPLLLVIFLPVLAIFIAIWNHWHEQIIDTVMTVWHAVSDFLSSTWASVVSIAQSAWAEVQTWIVQPTGEARDYLVGLWGEASAWLSGKWHGIENAARSAWRSVYEAIVQPVEKAADAVGTAVGKVASAVKGGISSAWNAAKEEAGKFINVGTEIINGIVKGIEGSWNWLKNKVKSLASDMLKAATDFLGINSPSKVFADHVGTSIPEGIAVGVQASAGVALAAVTALSGAAVDAGTINGLQQPAAVSLPAGVGAGQIVQHTTHITVQGSVLAERDLRDLVRQENLRDGARNVGTYQSYSR